MEPLRDLAIVLRSIPYGERHRIVTALTEQHGRITALAKNAIQSRRFGGTLDPFAASEWIFTLKPGTDLCQLNEAHSKTSFEGIRKSFEKLSLASVLSELMLKLAPENEPAPELFRLHANALASLHDEIPDQIEIILLNAYMGKLLQWSGNQPQMHCCFLCKQDLTRIATDTPEMELRCLIADAGWTCSRCRRQNSAHAIQQMQLNISPLAACDFVVSLNTPIRKVPSVSHASTKDHWDLFKFLEALFLYHIPGFDQTPLKSLRFLAPMDQHSLQDVQTIV